MIYRLMGLALPYGKHATGPIDGLYEVFDGGAATPAALAFDYGVFEIDHRTRVSGTIVRLIQTYAGIVCVASLPDSQQVRELMAARPSWKGLSVSFDRTTIQSAIDWSSATTHVRSVDYISGVSLSIARTPAYAETWVEPSSPSAVARIKSENAAALSAMYGSGYATRMPRSCWTQPRQSAWLESHLASHDPERSWLARFGEIPERW